MKKLAKNDKNQKEEISMSQIDEMLQDMKAYTNQYLDLEKRIKQKHFQEEGWKQISIVQLEENIAICQVNGQEELIPIKKELLPINIKVGNRLKLRKGRYEIDFSSGK